MIGRRALFVVTALLASSLAGTAWCQGVDPTVRVYVGTYTAGGSRGIYQLALHLENGELKETAATDGIKNPSFLAIHPNQRFLYAVSEVGDVDSDGSGAVQAFAIDSPSGVLTPLNQLSTGGQGPCHLVVDKSGTRLLVANYGGGSAAVMSIGEDGRLLKRTAFVQHRGSSVTPRQSAPHAHCIRADPSNRFVMVSDLGLDKLMVYRLERDGALSANDPAFAMLPPGSGPRHFRFHPNGRFLYAINELASTVSTFRYDGERGSLELLDTTSTLPGDFDGRSFTAEIVVSSDGRFLYGSNRGHDSIATFAIQENGIPKYVAAVPSGGKTPRNFAIEPSGRYLLAANQASNNIVVFSLDPVSGLPKPTGHQISIPQPVCLMFQ